MPQVKNNTQTKMSRGGGGHSGGGGFHAGGGGGGMTRSGMGSGLGIPMGSRSAGAIRSQGAFRGRGMASFPRGSISFSKPASFVSTCAGGGCGGDFGFRRRFFDNFVYYPYPYSYYSYALPSYPIVPLVTNYSVANPLTEFGTCQCAEGVGLVQNMCNGNVPLCTGGGGCSCYQRDTGLTGCGNVAGATCAPIVPSPFY